MAKPGGMFYFNMRPSSKLSDSERLQLYDAILDYSQTGEVPGLSGALGIVWDYIQPTLDEDNARYEATREKRPSRLHTRFSPPSVQKIEDYCTEKGFLLDAERFVDYYTSVGWKMGKNPMKDWRAAVRTWVKKDTPKPEPKNCGYILAPAENPFEVAMRQREAGYA